MSITDTPRIYVRDLKAYNAPVRAVPTSVRNDISPVKSDSPPSRSTQEEPAMANIETPGPEVEPTVTLTEDQLRDLVADVLYVNDAVAGIFETESLSGGERLAAYHATVKAAITQAPATFGTVPTPVWMALLADRDRRFETYATTALMGRWLERAEAEAAMSALGWDRWDGPIFQS